MFLLNPMRLNQVSHYLNQGLKSQGLKIPHTYSGNVDGIELKLNDCPGLITKDIHNRVKNHELNPSAITRLNKPDYPTLGHSLDDQKSSILDDQNNYLLTYNHQGKELMVNIPLGRKESYKA